ncbi:hypothetical protein ES703_51224 [subsurface metagenome]
MDNLPFVPYQEFISLLYHFSNQWINKNRVLTLNTSRGCPFSCQFCSVGSVWGNRYRFQSAERIIEEIIRLRKDFDAKGIYFREDNFTLNRKRLVEFCESILTKGLNFPWICETRADTLTEDMVKLMARAACRGFYLGAESGSQRVLNYMKKGITLNQLENVVNWSKKAGIRCYLSFVMGVPTEIEEERYATLFFIDRLKPYSYSLNVFTGIPFSPFYWQLIKDGNYALITPSGIVYQKNHNYLVDQFVGNMDCRVPISVRDSTKEMLPILRKVGKQQIARIAKTTLRQNYVDSTRQIGKKEEAVIHYFLGRAKLRARQFHSARTNFLNAFRKGVKLKYFIFTCATLLPSRSYSFFAKMVNKVKRI